MDAGESDRIPIGETAMKRLLMGLIVVAASIPVALVWLAMQFMQRAPKPRIDMP